MLAPWLLYTSFFGVLIGVAGLLGEQILRWRGAAARWVWVAAIMTMVAIPVLLSVRPRPAIPATVAAVSSVSREVPSVVELPGPSLPPHNYDAPLLALWLVASSVVLLRVIGAAAAMRRRRRSWIPAQLGGQSVLLANDLGPAVIGWRRFTTVIPRWALSFDESSREMMLAHEAEHASSGDPYLRSVALVALILMPWNPALWFAMRRLRLAVEMDCDQRVLARGVDPQQYASLLLAVGERMLATPFAWATALGGTRSFLETRVRGMVAPWVPRYPRLAIGASGVAALLVAIVACRAPVPEAMHVAVRQAADSLAPECKAEGACEDTTVQKYRNWVIRARKSDTTLHLHGQVRTDCRKGGRSCVYVVAGTGSDTLFVDPKSGKVWSSTPADDIEIGSRTVTVDRYGTYCTDKSDCGRGTEPTFTGIIARSMNIFARPAPDFVVVRGDEVPICTPAQAAAKRRAMSAGDFSPRCVIE